MRFGSLEGSDALSCTIQPVDPPMSIPIKAVLIIMTMGITDVALSFRPTVRRHVVAARRKLSTPNCLTFPPHEGVRRQCPARRCATSMAMALSSDMNGWTVGRTLRDSIQKLDDGDVTEPTLSIRHLLSASLELPWETGYRDLDQLSDQRLTPKQALDFSIKLDRRLKHEPIQYILGQWDFLDYTVTIRPPLLCPRPETEEMVEKIIQETTESPIHILDVGCGTGVIGLSLAERLPDATVEAIDVEPVAVETSLENARRILGESPSRTNCYQATLVSAADFSPVHRFDIVVSNPPYIPRADMATLSMDVVKYESETALCGGEDGLDVVRTIIRKLPYWCNSGAVCWMEVDPSHPKLIREWLQANPYLDVKFDSIFKDMFGKDRFVRLTVK